MLERKATCRLQGIVSRDIQGNFMTQMDISTPGEEPLQFFKILKGFSDFTLHYNIEHFATVNAKSTLINIVNFL
jgi:hypothetical protein